MKRSKFIKQAGALGAALAMTATPVMAATDPAAIEPVPGPHGYFVDTYKTNVMENQSPESNAVVGVLSPFLNIWEPGSSWDNGTKLGEDGKRLLDQNIFTCITMTQNRTPERKFRLISPTARTRTGPHWTDWVPMKPRLKTWQMRKPLCRMPSLLMQKRKNTVIRAMKMEPGPMKPPLSAAW